MRPFNKLQRIGGELAEARLRLPSRYIVKQLRKTKVTGYGINFCLVRGSNRVIAGISYAFSAPLVFVIKQPGIQHTYIHALTCTYIHKYIHITYTYTGYETTHTHTHTHTYMAWGSVVVKALRY